MKPPDPGHAMPRRFPFRLFAALPVGDPVPDGELLRRFVATRDAAAFELLVRRHADAVWTAAVRILANDSDAEDAFQATFLALVRKASSVRGACAGAWLHRVAVNAALKLKASRERERPEEGSPEGCATRPWVGSAWGDSVSSAKKLARGVVFRRRKAITLT